MKPATILSWDESNLFKQAMNDAGIFEEGYRYSAWLGGYDIGHEGKWIWITTGQHISQTFWSKGNPDNFFNQQHFLAGFLRKNTLQWDDSKWDRHLYVACEYYK